MEFPRVLLHGNRIFCLRRKITPSGRRPNWFANARVSAVLSDRLSAACQRVHDVTGKLIQCDDSLVSLHSFFPQKGTWEVGGDALSRRHFRGCVSLCGSPLGIFSLFFLLSRVVSNNNEFSHGRVLFTYLPGCQMVVDRPSCLLVGGKQGNDTCQPASVASNASMACNYFARQVCHLH
jgi:hypothetical protein